MSTYNLELKFHGGDVEQGELPNAAAWIVLKTWTRDDDSKAPVISPMCVGPTELEFEVNRLKHELDEILRRGRQQFAAYRSTTLAAIDRKQQQRSEGDQHRF